MEDLQVKIKMLLADAEDCEIIAGVAPDGEKRKLFERLAGDLRRLARDIEFIVTARRAVGD
jgi:hypothetical protein